MASSFRGGLSTEKTLPVYSVVHSCPSDFSLGPFSKCRYFDFTLLFEQWVLSGLPSAILLVAGVIRLHQLHKQNAKVIGNRVGLIKLICTIVNLMIQLTLLVLWTKEAVLETGSKVLFAAINLAAAVGIVLLSYREHSLSIGSSTVLEVFFIATSFFDVLQIRTLYLLNASPWLQTTLGLSVCCKVVLLGLETRDKEPYLKSAYHSISPESRSGLISQSFIWWLNGIFTAQYRDFFDEYKLDSDLSSEHVGEKMQMAWEGRDLSDGEMRFTLIWAMCRGLGGAFVPVLLPRVCLIIFTFAQPFLISEVLSLLQGPETEESQTKGHFLILVTLLIYVGIAISSLHSNHALNRFITIFRGSFVYLIYDKTLALKARSYDESSALTLMGADVDRVAFCLEELNECWSRLIEVVVGLFLLTRQLGWVSVTPVVVVALSTMGSSIVARRIGQAQKTWSDATQSRIKATTSMLKEMKSIKMSGLSSVLGDTVQKKRVEETKKMESWVWIIVWLNVFANIPVMLAPAATFGVYAIQAAVRGSDSLNTVQAFTSLALISLVSHPVSRLLSAIPNTAASMGCFDRIQAFLAAKPYHESRRVVSEIANAHGLALAIRRATISPSNESDFVLREVNIAILQGSLTIVVGPVGCGKTTLLKTMLGELESSSGEVVSSHENFAYCNQTPWLINGSIKEAICGFDTEGVDEIWYRTVLGACELETDLANFADGDRTIIGSRGTKLSGGQKQRIALARAVYSKRCILLLDDVLSALDGQTERKVVSQLFGENGSFSGLLKKMRCTVILVTHSTQLLMLADQIIAIDTAGNVTCETPNQAKNLSISPGQETVDDLAKNTKKEEDKKPDVDEFESKVEGQDLERKPGDPEVYKYYYKSIGSRKLLVFLFFVVLNVFSSSFSQIWLKWWTDHDGHQIVLYASVYLFLSIGYSVGIGGYAWAMAVVIGPSTGRKLHRTLLETVLRAPQSFFDITELGSIMNRFVQDMSLIEGQLAYGVLATVSNLLAALAETVLIAIASPFAIFALPPLFLVMYTLQHFYLRTSRQLRHWELESRSPVYSHFLETLEGITSIRAFGWQHECRKRFTQRLDDSQKPYYLMFCIQNWLGLVLDLISAGMAVTVVSLALSMRHWTSPGLLGIAMNNVLSFNLSLSAFLTGYTVLETSLGAIARLKFFEATTELEDKSGENTLPPADWPSQGAIEIKNVSVEYRNSIKALNGISLKIEAGQHVSICGRTGSGKSTLLSTILRLHDLTSGTMTIDSVDISHVPRSKIRQQIISISQDSLYLQGTLRFNLDPFSSFPDEDLVTALSKVDSSWKLNYGANLDVEISPDTLSKGQFQLLGLARALLRTSRLVLMDEVTSSIDPTTAERMDNLVREQFRACTVLKVAHRKETILNADVVVVMDLGKIVEIGEPKMLMGSKVSRLRALLEDGKDV